MRTIKQGYLDTLDKDKLVKVEGKPAETLEEFMEKFKFRKACIPRAMLQYMKRYQRWSKGAKIPATLRSAHQIFKHHSWRICEEETLTFPGVQ